MRAALSLAGAAIVGTKPRIAIVNRKARFSFASGLFRLKTARRYRTFACGMLPEQIARPKCLKELRITAT